MSTHRSVRVRNNVTSRAMLFKKLKKIENVLESDSTIVATEFVVVVMSLKRISFFARHIRKGVRRSIKDGIRYVAIYMSVRDANSKAKLERTDHKITAVFG